jgi:hypothetical protein
MQCLIAGKDPGILAPAKITGAIKTFFFLRFSENRKKKTVI